MEEATAFWKSAECTSCWHALMRRWYDERMAWMFSMFMKKILQLR